jgi:hypothetical protein
MPWGARSKDDAMQPYLDHFTQLLARHQYELRTCLMQWALEAAAAGWDESELADFAAEIAERLAAQDLGVEEAFAPAYALAAARAATREEDHDEELELPEDKDTEEDTEDTEEADGDAAGAAETAG